MAPGKLFGVTAGFIWRLTGEHIEAFGGDHVHLRWTHDRALHARLRQSGAGTMEA